MIHPPTRCIFVHIPKTAGHSINRFFGTGWQNHRDLASYARELPPEIFADYFKFAIVRNPWERLLSDYNFQKKKNWAPEHKLFLHDENGKERNFREWVRAVLADPFRYAPAAWGGQVSPGIHRWSPQVDWISLDGKIAVDRVILLENLGREFPDLRRRLALPADALRRRNRRFHWHYSHYYDAATRRLVADYYERDTAAFGHRFSAPRPLYWIYSRLRPREAAGKPVRPAAGPLPV